MNGPRIQLSLDSRGFRPGDIVSANPMLIADLFDSSGVNTSGAGIGHRIEAWLDGKPESIDLTEFYRSKIDSFQHGTVEYTLTGLSQGTHRLRLRAWDTYNNSSTAETVFDIVERVGLRISDVFNYPNPFSSATVFTFRHNQLDPIRSIIKIYTVAGRLIKTIEEDNIPDQFVKMEWDGRDEDGDLLANGVYLYKVVVKTTDKRLASEEFGKLSILR